MPGEVTTRQRTDEDTDLGFRFQGHKTNQIGSDQPEQNPSPDDWKQRQTGPERSPQEPSSPGQHKEAKGNRENRK
jgi:hypothetical protein